MASYGDEGREDDHYQNPNLSSSSRRCNSLRDGNSMKRPQAGNLPVLDPARVLHDQLLQRDVDGRIYL